MPTLPSVFRLITAGGESVIARLTLKDYDWRSEEDIARAWTPDPRQDREDRRSPFERDRARIIHSVAFRRLQGKTQIFAPGSADFVRTRVTHSIEVAQIGRALAQRFDVDDSLVEAACLGHDLGHPPFGHTGEDVLANLMSGKDGSDDYGSFEGNAQSFRIATYIEQKTAEYPGLDLCRATLHGLLKYPYTRAAGHTKFLYDDDVARYEEFLFGGRENGFLTSTPGRKFGLTGRGGVMSPEAKHVVDAEERRLRDRVERRGAP